MGSNEKKINPEVRFYAPYTSGLTLQTAKKMLEAAVKEAERLGIAMTIAIVDAGEIC